MGVHPWNWLGRRKADEWLLHNRGQFAVVIAAAITLQIVALIAALLKWKWPAGWFPPVTISDQVEALLATGTLALAFAALVQAVGGLEATRTSHRPSLILAAGAAGLGTSAPPDNPGLQGTTLSIRNLGPGVAKDVRFTWFRFPETDEAKAYIKKLSLKVQATGVLGTYRTFLGVEPTDWWEIAIDTSYPGMDFIVEIAGRDVFDRETGTARYHLHHEPDTTGATSGLWLILAPPENDPDRVPTIQQMIERAKNSKPPYYWDV